VVPSNERGVLRAHVLERNDYIERQSRSRSIEPTAPTHHFQGSHELHIILGSEWD
jgi:hypothetical protein